MKSTKERTMNFISSTEHEARLFPHKATKTTSLEKKKNVSYIARWSLGMGGSSSDLAIICSF